MDYLQQCESPEEKLAIVRKLRDEKRILLTNIDQAYQLKLSILKKEVEARDVLAEYLRDDSQFLSLKEDVEEDMSLSEVASIQAETKKKKELMMESTPLVAGLLAGFDEELKDIQKASENTLRMISVSTGAASKARKDLASAVKERSGKRTQLTDFARAHVSSRAQELPSEVLCMIFSVLPTEDLVTVGQVCQRWRGVTRSERADLLWTNRRLVLEDPSAGTRMRCRGSRLVLDEALTCGLMRILFAAPILGHVAFNTSVRKHVKDTRCKILSMEITNQEWLGFSGLFKRHAPHLTSLTLKFLSPNLVAAVSSLPQLKELALLIRENYHGALSFSFGMNSSIERLKLSGYICSSLATMNSLLIPHAVTLKSFSLEGAASIPSFREARENLVSRLGKCVSLEELKLPVCHDTLDFCSTPIKLKCLTLSFPSCRHYNNNIMPSRYLFAPGSVADLSIVLLNADTLGRVTRFLKSLEPAFRASVKSVSFTCLSTLSAGIGQFESDIKEIPEFREGKCVFKWHA